MNSKKLKRIFSGFVVVLVICLILFLCGIISSKQIEIVGIFSAIITLIFSIYLHFEQKLYKQSETYLNESIKQFENVIELISNNNSRVKWITGSRILASVHLFSEKIEIPEHKEIFETQKLKYKTIISDILEDKDKSGAFFYGSDDWSESIDEAAKKSTIPEKDQKAQGLISTLKGIAEVSLHTLWEFTLFPKNYEDPLKNEGFNDDEINFKVQSRFPGLFDYLKHKRKYHSINGELVEYEKKR